MSPSTTTSRRSRQSNTQGQLLFAGDHRANPSHAPGSDWARKTTASSGKRLFPSFSESDPLGAYSKTLLGSEQWASMEFLLNWRIITTPQGRSVFQLAPSAPRTGESDTGLFAKGWPTPNHRDEDKFQRRVRTDGGQVNLSALANWPTPRSEDSGSPGAHRGVPDTLTSAAKAWATPNHRDVKLQNGAGFIARGGQANVPTQVKDIGQITSGCLARTEKFVERLTTLSAWLMGYTGAYLAHWATASSRRSPKSSSKP